MKKIHAGLVLAALCFASFFGAGITAYVLRPAGASRNSSGTMSAINGPYVAGTVISSTTVNARFADIETEITDSASRSGKGGFSAPVRAADGAVGAPAFSWTSETGSGWYRVGSSDLGLAVAGARVGQVTANGYRSANGALATPSLSFVNDTGSGLFRNASNDIRFAVNGTLIQAWGTTGMGTGAAPPANVGFQAAGGGGGWSSSNIGKQIIVDNVVASSNPAIGIFDSTSANPWAIVNSAGALGFYTMPALTDAATAPVQRFGLSATGIAADTTAFKHKRGTAGCATAAAIGANCSTAVAWTTAFADTSYSPFCSCSGVTSGVPVIGNISVAAGQLTVFTVATTAAAAQCTTIICMGVHD